MSQHSRYSLIGELVNVAGSRNILTRPSRTRHYSTGFRIGGGKCLAVVKPRSLYAIWRVLEVCIAHDAIILMQAANTGLNGGSTPDGDDYDRPVVIINTLHVNSIFLLGEGKQHGAQIVALAGATLYQLENQLDAIGRSPHSVIGSSCIGASIVGGVCNNSGGNLVNRGPAYTELALFARLSKEGRLELVNHLGLELGDSPATILNNLEAGNFDKTSGLASDKFASDRDYQRRVRDICADTPARFNADPRRLHEASGCAGKLAVFAVRLDSFPTPKKSQVFYIGSNSAAPLNAIRKQVLEEFAELPEMGEYMHRSYFDASAKYAKDNFLFIKYFGSAFLPRLFAFKSWINGWMARLPLMPAQPIDRLLQTLANCLPDHLPLRLRQYRERFEHHLIIKACDRSIEATRQLLESTLASHEAEYFVCGEREGEAALLHRFVAGGAFTRYALINSDSVGEVLALDIALRRNDDDWHAIYPEAINRQIAAPLVLSHFFCRVFHHDLVLKKGVDAGQLKKQIIELLDQRGAKYPAEHNVGHFYTAEKPLRDFYQHCDPVNVFNAGVGKTSKKKFYA